VARRCLANARRGELRRMHLVDRLQAEHLEPLGVAGTATDGPLEEALATLTAEARELLRLWAWEQLTPREIAVVLGISANAVSIRLHRARQHLVEALGKIDEPAGHMVDGHAVDGPAKEAP
jgi:RNA polymerase sigma-70 factor (ECF subfamily)